MRKGGKKRAAGRRRRVGRARATNVREMASLSVKRTLTPGNGNTMYNISNVSLVDFPRAVTVAKAYQFFRIKSIRVTWKPVYDTYSSATLQQKPNFYHMVDKSAGIPLTITLEGLKQMGARPRAYDEKPISVSWAPSVLNDAQNSIGSIASSYRISPWLITNSGPDQPAWNPSQVQHNGLFWYVETGGVTQAINLELECQFEFKKPLVEGTGATSASTLSYAVIDASPDGVEGGTDGITLPLGH